MNQRQKWIVIVTILASGIVFLDSSVVNIALPSIDRDLQAGLSGLQWIVDGYLLTLASLLILGGSLGDHFGRKKVMLIGLVGFGAASMLCGLSWSVGILIAARMLQGLFGALIVPGSLALLREHFVDDETRGNAVGLWSGWSGVTTVIGPLLGGWLVDTLTWRWVFFINLPIVAASVYLLANRVPESHTPAEKPALDWAGTVLIVFGFGGIIFGLIQGPVIGWLSLPVLGALVSGTVLLFFFPFLEQRKQNPLIPIAIFQHRAFSVANLTTLLVYFGLYGMTFFLVIFLQTVQGYSAFLAGLTTAPISLALLVLSPLFGRLAGRFGPRWFMTAGPLLCAAGLLAFIRLGPEPAFWADLLPAVLLFALGMSITVSPLTNTVISSVPEAHSGLASAINNAVSRIAALLAIALLGVVVSQSYQAALQQQISQRSLPEVDQRILQQNQSNPTGALSADLSDPARQAVDQAYTQSFRRAMIVAALTVATGGLVSAIFLRNPADEDKKQTEHELEKKNEPNA